jgi:feruloyl-CoA synthase
MGDCHANLVTRADGTMLVTNQHPLAPYPKKITEKLDHWAKVAPDRIWLAARENGQWRTISYREGRDQVRRIASALLERGLSAERPLMILSGNDLDHALLGMGALYAGCAYAPVSPAYSLISSDHSKLKYMIELLTPGLIFVADGKVYERAIASAIPEDCELIVSQNPPASRTSTPFSALLAKADDARVDAAHDKIGPQTIAKFLFTSGSTGMPKAVINTQLMLCSNMAMCSAHFAFMQNEPPVTLDWSPWNHTAGGNHDFNLILYNGGSFYIDEGKPTPGGIEATVRNLRDVSPTWYFNVPKGYAALVPYLREDPELCQNFFKNLNMLWYAGAGMAQHVWNELDELSIRTTGERVIILTGLGATETAPFAIAANQTMIGAGNVGLPGRGLELKLVPNNGKLEARVRGPNITPGYWRQPDLTKAAFDEEGFYKLGDALRFVDESDVNRGFVFDGRTSENFKLNTGTWVLVGALRSAFIDHFAPLVQDVVITGIDQDYIGALIFPDLDACRGFVGWKDAKPEEVLAHTRLRAEFEAKLKSLAKQNTGSSTLVKRAIVLVQGPQIDRSEMTDKGSINQRAVLDNRRDLVDLLYSAKSDERILEA